MNRALKRRVARLEAAHPATRDWRQFGPDPRDMPDWALLANLLWHYEQDPELKDDPRVIEARRLYDVEEIDAAFQALRSFECD